MAVLMQFNEGEYFKVISKDGCSGLMTNPTDEESVEGCRKAINRANVRAVENGYTPQQFIIVRRVWNRICFPDGMLKESRETTSFVEIYPKELRKEGER